MNVQYPGLGPFRLWEVNTFWGVSLVRWPNNPIKSIFVICLSGLSHHPNVGFLLFFLTSGARCHQVPVPESSLATASCGGAPVGVGLQWSSGPSALKALDFRSWAGRGGQSVTWIHSQCQQYFLLLSLMCGGTLTFPGKDTRTLSDNELNINAFNVCLSVTVWTSTTSTHIDTSQESVENI